jgi:ABC-type antimicrobial peptide transport system permease subunit
VSYRYDTFRNILEPELMTWRVAGVVLGFYGIIAVLVAAGGVFSSIAFLLAQRSRELAIRRALGAPFATLLGDIGGRLSRDCLVGMFGAIVAMIALWAQSRTLFFATQPIDVALASLLATGAVQAVILAGVLWGAGKSWRSNPLSALRAS